MFTLLYDTSLELFYLAPLKPSTQPVVIVFLFSVSMILTTLDTSWVEAYGIYAFVTSLFCLL